MINYSEFGTVVDSVIYTGEEVRLQIGRKDFHVHPLTNLLFFLKNDLEEKQSDDLEMASTPCNKFCKCSSSPAEQAGLGCGLGAIVQHGSYLRFGCLEVVTAISIFGVITVKS